MVDFDVFFQILVTIPPTCKVTITKAKLEKPVFTFPQQLMEFLLENQSLQCNVNGLEPAHGESPLTAAASRGKSEVCDFLITRYNATLTLRNKSEHTPLLCAVRQVRTEPCFSSSYDHFLTPFLKLFGLRF